MVFRARERSLEIQIFERGASVFRVSKERHSINGASAAIAAAFSSGQGDLTWDYYSATFLTGEGSRERQARGREP